MRNEYKTYEELKEELGNKFEEYMYKANIELLEKIDIGGFCELKKKCDEGLCDCTNEEYNSMAECNMRLSLENQELKKRIDKAIELIKRSAGYKGICTQPETDTFSKLLEILGGNNGEIN